MLQLSDIRVIPQFKLPNGRITNHEYAQHTHIRLNITVFRIVYHHIIDECGSRTHVL